MQYTVTEFETLYKRCLPPSMRLAFSLLHDEHEARDIVQGVFLKLWESEARVENPMTFVMRSVRNACLNRINMLDTHDKILRRITLESPPDDYDAELQNNEEILSAISKLLTKREQEIVERIYTEGMSYKETAESLGISVSAVNKNIVSALKKLRNHFKIGKS